MHCWCGGAWPGAAVLEAIHDLDDMRLETIEVDRALVVLDDRPE